jgi:hypothetical protein
MFKNSYYFFNRGLCKMGGKTSKARNAIESDWLDVSADNPDGISVAIQSEQTMEDGELIDWISVEETQHRVIPYCTSGPIHFGCQHPVDFWKVADRNMRKKGLSRYPASHRRKIEMIWDQLLARPEIPHFQDLILVADLSVFQFTVQESGKPPVYYRGVIARDNTIQFKIFQSGY